MTGRMGERENVRWGEEEKGRMGETVMGSVENP
jgi:hypothetical protein